MLTQCQTSLLTGNNFDFLNPLMTAEGNTLQCSKLAEKVQNFKGIPRNTSKDTKVRQRTSDWQSLIVQ